MGFASKLWQLLFWVVWDCYWQMSPLADEDKCGRNVFDKGVVPSGMFGEAFLLQGDGGRTSLSIINYYLCVFEDAHFT